MLKRVFWKHHHGSDGGDSSDSDSDTGSESGQEAGGTLSEEEIAQQSGSSSEEEEEEDESDIESAEAEIATLKDNTHEQSGVVTSSATGSDGEAGSDEEAGNDGEAESDEGAASDRKSGSDSDADDRPAAQTWHQFLESRDAEEEEEEEGSDSDDDLECFRSTTDPLDILNQGEALKCFPCGVLLINASAYSTHVKSKKHERTVAKWPGAAHNLQPVVRAADVKGKYEAEETHTERLERMQKEAEEAAERVARKAAAKKRKRNEHKEARKRPGKRQRAALKAEGLMPPPKRRRADKGGKARPKVAKPSDDKDQQQLEAPSMRAEGGKRQPHKALGKTTAPAARLPAANKIMKKKGQANQRFPRANSGS